jgi:hypothetical protein
MRTVYANGKELRYETEDELALLMQDEIICAALHRYSDAAAERVKKPHNSAGARRAEIKTIFKPRIIDASVE